MPVVSCKWRAACWPGQSPRPWPPIALSRAISCRGSCSPGPGPGGKGHGAYGQDYDYRGEEEEADQWADDNDDDHPLCLKGQLDISDVGKIPDYEGFLPKTFWKRIPDAASL